MNCRHCGTKLEHTFIDLGFAPPSNAYLKAEDLNKPELYFPLRVKVCHECWLVQTEDYAEADALFTADYAYFSSTSSSWLAHAEQYAHKMIEELKLGKDSFVLEIASNDGYLLKNFVKKGIPCLGVEPTDKTADAAEALGVPVLREFFGQELANKLTKEAKQADLICGNNVYAHVPDINDFTKGLKIALKTGGTITLEFPHLMRLIENAQFDTIYHEHFSYLSLHTVCRIFEYAGLRVWHVEELATHGGSLRVYGCHEDDPRKNQKSVVKLLQEEKKRGLQDLQAYLNFQIRTDIIKDSLLNFLIEQKKEGKKVIAYGAAAKGNTLLNYAGIKPDLLPIVVDASPYKQGKHLPGSHILIMNESIIKYEKPDFILILPWNIKNEVSMQLSYIRKWGATFITAIPNLKLW